MLPMNICATIKNATGYPVCLPDGETKSITEKEKCTMAKFKPEAGETLIGSGTMALHQKQFLNTRSFDGTIYVTDRRVCFQIRMMKDLEMDLPLEQVKGFGVKKAMMITTVTICGREGESYAFTGFSAKKLQDWLRQAGVQEL